MDHMFIAVVNTKLFINKNWIKSCGTAAVTHRVRSAHLSPGLPTGLTRVNPGWVLSLILEKVGSTG